jgi:hypothetical protein
MGKSSKLLLGLEPPEVVVVLDMIKAGANDDDAAFFLQYVRLRAK